MNGKKMAVLSAIFTLCAILATSGTVSACFTTYVSCEGKTTGAWAGDYGGVPYKSLDLDPVTVANSGVHSYDIVIKCSGGCENSGVNLFFFIWYPEGEPSGWSAVLTDSADGSGTNLHGKTIFWAKSTWYTADKHAYLKVTAPASGSSTAKINVKLWINGTSPANERCHCDVKTITQVGGGGPSGPSITVTSPNGGEKWEVGTTHPVTWTATGGTGTIKVKLELSTTGNSGPWTTIADDEDNDGSFTWTVPNSPSTNCFIRATATDSASPPATGTDLSNAAFEITPPAIPIPKVTVTSPIAGDEWEKLSTHDITWTANDGTGTLTIDIQYSTTGMAGPWATIATGETNDGKYSWTLPATVSDNCLVKVIATDTNSQKGEGISGQFKITHPPLNVKVVSPNGGEIWLVGDKKDITWTATGGSGSTTINIEFSTNGGATFESIVTGEANDGAYTWTVPNKPSTDCIVRVIAMDPLVTMESDESDTKFTIRLDTEKPSIEMLSPIGGEKWSIGTQHEINWNAYGGTGELTIKIEYSTSGNGGPWTQIATGEPNDGSFTWTVPNSPSTNCYIKITVKDSAVIPHERSTMNSLPFTITSKSIPQIRVTSPNGGEQLTVGSQHEITWDSLGGTGILKVKIEYSISGPTGPWEVIADNAPDTKKYTWDVPYKPTVNGYIRIMATDEASPPETSFDMNNAPFTITQWIVPRITVLSPNGGEKWEAGTQKEIKWDASGGTGGLKISLKYSTKGAGGPYLPIISNQDNTGSYIWTVPNEPSTTCYIQAFVEDSANPPQSSMDISNAAFEITGATKGMITGVVKNTAGKALKDVTINVFNQNVIVHTTKTIVDGSYTIQIAPGTYQINATADGYYASEKVTVTVKAGQETTQNFQMKPFQSEKTHDDEWIDDFIDINNPMFLGIIIAVLLLVLLPIIAVAASRRRKKGGPQQQWTQHNAVQPPPPPSR